MAMKTIKNPYRITIKFDDARFNTYKIVVEENAKVVDDGNGGFCVESNIEEYRSCGFALHISSGGGGVVFDGNENGRRFLRGADNG